MPNSQNAYLLSRQAARESNARSYPRRLPLAIREAAGLMVTDMDGRTFFDCLGGAGTLALGHNHPVVLDAIRTTLDEGVPLHTLDLTTPAKDAFVETLLDKIPGALGTHGRIHFCGPTGADAVEAAIKLAKTVTGRAGLLAFSGGYHGSTHATMAISGSLHQKAEIAGLMPGVQFLPYPYAFRCPFGVGGEEGWRLGARYVEGLLDDPESGVLPPAAMILEVVQGEGGAIAAPDGWLREMRRITARHGILLIVDEVQTGLGRTGTLFAFERAGIEPDILVLSKAVGGGLPLSVIVYQAALDRWKPGAHIGTFRGNQLAMAAGLASLRYISEAGLVDNAAARGRQLAGKLRALAGTPAGAAIGEVRGRGLMIGVEIVDAYGGLDIFGRPRADPAAASAIQRACFERGLIVELGGRHGAVVRFLPPLIVDAGQVDAIFDLFAAALEGCAVRQPVAAE